MLRGLRKRVGFGFQDANLFDKCVESRRAFGDDAGGAHGIVVGMQVGKLVVIGDELHSAVEALIVIGVASVKKHLLVPDNILQEGAVGECCLADLVFGKAGQVEPVPRKAFGLVSEAMPMAFDMDEGRLLPEGSCRGEDGHRCGGVVQVRSLRPR